MGTCLGSQPKTPPPTRPARLTRPADPLARPPPPAPRPPGRGAGPSHCSSQFVDRFQSGIRPGRATSPIDFTLKRFYSCRSTMTMESTLGNGSLQIISQKQNTKTKRIGTVVLLADGGARIRDTPASCKCQVYLDPDMPASGAHRVPATPWSHQVRVCPHRRAAPRAQPNQRDLHKY